jgi:hypothetical protein
MLCYLQSLNSLLLYLILSAIFIPPDAANHRNGERDVYSYYSGTLHFSSPLLSVPSRPFSAMYGVGVLFIYFSHAHTTINQHTLQIILLREIGKEREDEGRWGGGRGGMRILHIISFTSDDVSSHEDSQ